MSILFLKQSGLSNKELVGYVYGGIPACAIFVDLEPGHGPRLHKHPYAELFFVIEGESTFADGGERRLVRAGEVVIEPGGQPPAFTNTGEGRLRQIDVHLSPRFDTEWLEAS
jgi:mannose-6-phosphate isomerase-like protein (cupin superfamily)